MQIWNDYLVCLSRLNTLRRDSTIKQNSSRTNKDKKRKIKKKKTADRRIQKFDDRVGVELEQSISQFGGETICIATQPKSLIRLRETQEIDYKPGWQYQRLDASDPNKWKKWHHTTESQQIIRSGWFGYIGKSFCLHHRRNPSTTSITLQATEGF